VELGGGASDDLLEDLPYCVGARGGGVEEAPPAAGVQAAGAVEVEHVEVHVQPQVGAEALDDGDRAALGRAWAS
jgi:hypothetical protein